MGADVVELAVRRGAEVDRRCATARGGRPGRAEELLAGGDQVVGAAADPLGLDHDDLGVVGHHVDEQLELVDEHRGQRLHPLDGDPGRDLGGHLRQLGVGLAERGRAAAYVIGQQQLAAGRCPEPRQLVDRALVGDREGADLVDLVAPELHPHRVLLGRREHVDEPAADRELAALLHQVDPRVGRVRQPAYDVVEGDRVTRGELDRLEVTEAADLRLQDRPDRRDHDAQPTRAGPRLRVTQPAQHREPATRRCRCAG